MRVHLRPGTTVDTAISTLERLSLNAYGEAMPVGSPDPSSIRENYVQWANKTEGELQGILGRQDARELFDNPRHRDICSMPAGSQLRAIINAEVSDKSTQLRELVEYLREVQARSRRAPGLPAVVDANLLLQCLRPDQIKWRELLGEQTRLVLALRVIEELDAKKYGSNQRLRQVSREVLSWLEGLFPGSDPGPVSLGDTGGSTIEIRLADRPRYRPTDADEEVLDTCDDLKLLAGRATLVTADTGMLLRARSLSLDVCKVSGIYLRIKTEAEAATEPIAVPGHPG